MQIMLDETLNVWWVVMCRCQRQSYNFDFARFVLFHFVLCQLEEEVFASNDLCCDSVEWHFIVVLIISVNLIISPLEFR